VTSLHPFAQHDCELPQAGPPAQVLVHIDFTHAPPFVQTFPHAPQFALSLVVSLHPSAQHVSPTLQLQTGGVQLPPFPSKTQHLPSRQVCPFAHARPQPPQLLPSLVSSTHSAPQHERLGAQPAVVQVVLGTWHVPLRQVSPCGQRKPHPPQLLGSLSTSRQPDAQQSSPPGQPVDAHEFAGGVHTPSKQEESAGQTTPQPPQLFGSKLMLAVQASFGGCASFVPPSPAMHVSVAGSQVVPEGHCWFSQEGPFGRPSSP